MNNIHCHKKSLLKFNGIYASKIASTRGAKSRIELDNIHHHEGGRQGAYGRASVTWEACSKVDYLFSGEVTCRSLLLSYRIRRGLWSGGNLGRGRDNQRGVWMTMLRYIHCMPTRWRPHEIGGHRHAGLGSYIHNLGSRLQALHQAHELLALGQELLILSHEIRVPASRFQPSLLHLSLDGSHLLGVQLVGFPKPLVKLFIIFSSFLSNLDTNIGSFFTLPGSVGKAKMALYILTCEPNLVPTCVPKSKSSV